jgi:hypothetical protein
MKGAFFIIPRKFDMKPQVILVGNILLLQHSTLRVPMNWHTCLVSSRLFSGTTVREQRKAFTTTISTSQDFFLVLQNYLLALCNFLTLGRLHHCEYSCPFRFAKHFSLFCFCIFCFSCFLSVFFLLLLYAKIHKN